LKEGARKIVKIAKKMSVSVTYSRKNYRILPITVRNVTNCNISYSDSEEFVAD
jgi:hypothetical protein